jgi:hypothetical protein
MRLPRHHQATATGSHLTSEIFNDRANGCN